MARRVLALAAMLLLYGLAAALADWSFPVYRNASGVEDLGHLLVPPLLPLLGQETTQYVFWMGTLPLELFFVVIALVVLFTGKGIRLGICLYVAYFLHWLFLHATTLPPPDNSVWQFPPGVFTLGRPHPSDFWFSGHTANAVLIALATDGQRAWIKGLAWANVAFQILLVLSTRTHYTIDILGGIFVAYSLHKVSQGAVELLDRRTPPPFLS
jgi:PAP2 superfamily C-terminal